MHTFLLFIVWLCQVFSIVIFVRVIVSWFAPSSRNPIVAFLNMITDPLLAPLRPLRLQAGMFDLTPMVAGLILILIARLIAFYFL